MSDWNWRDDASCKGLPTEWWYPDLPSDEMDDGTVGPTEHLYEKGREICATCPVQSECLQDAVDNKEQYGMWGGAAPIGRKRIERKHRRRRMIERRMQEAEALFEEDEHEPY